MAEYPSLAKEFFDQIKKGGESFLEGLTKSDPPTFEDEWLDFKMKPATDDNTRAIWCKALSAFANTQGGVLIWGIKAVKAERDGRSIDAAEKVVPIDDADALKSRLLELKSTATDPPVQDVEIDIYPGFVVCYVPLSPFRPHQALWGKTGTTIHADGKKTPVFGRMKQFYMRIGPDTEPPSTAVIRQLFYPRTHVELKAWVVLETRSAYENHTRETDLLCHLFVENVGLATAENLFLRLEVSPHEQHFANGNDWTLDRKTLTDPESPICHTMNAAMPVHPGVKMEPIEITWRFPSHFGSLSEFTIQLQFFARNAEPVQAARNIARDELPHQGSPREIPLQLVPATWARSLPRT